MKQTGVDLLLNYFEELNRNTLKTTSKLIITNFFEPLYSKYLFQIQYTGMKKKIPKFF